MRISPIYKTQRWHFIPHSLVSQNSFNRQTIRISVPYSAYSTLSQDVYTGLIKAATTHDFFFCENLQSNPVGIAVLTWDVYLWREVSQD